MACPFRKAIPARYGITGFACFHPASEDDIRGAYHQCNVSRRGDDGCYEEAD